MSAIPQQLIERQKETFNSFINVQNTLFSGFEKLVDLNLKVMKANLGDFNEQSKQAAELKDPQEAANFVTTLSQPNAEKVIAYNKDVYKILSNLNAELVKFSEEQVNETQKQLSETVEELSKNAPTGSESAVALLKSAISSANNAYDSINKAAKQAAEATEANLNAATNATIKAAENASKATKASK